MLWKYVIINWDRNDWILYIINYVLNVNGTGSLWKLTGLQVNLPLRKLILLHDSVQTAILILGVFMQGSQENKIWSVISLEKLSFNIKTLNPPRGTCFGKKFSTVGNSGTFNLFKWSKITTWQEVQAVTAGNMKDRQKMHGAFFEDKGMFPKVHWWIFGGFRKVPSQNT